MNFTYHPRSKKQIRAIFHRKKSRCDFNFINVEDFEEWYNSRDSFCSICGVDEATIQELVLSGKLKSKRFPKDGLISRGRTRGVWLEIDKSDPELGYSSTNCSLVCYFCNNDKSDVFAIQDYRHFAKNRRSYLVELQRK